MATEHQKIIVQETREKPGEAESAEPKRVEYLTAKQLAQILQISESTIHKLRRAGKIPAVMLTDRLIRFNLKDVKHALRASHTNDHPQHHSTHAEEPDPQLSLFTGED
ncbi:MAG: helix-turn-helix domain-containing protein [Acidobacteriota bacterium]